MACAEAACTRLEAAAGAPLDLLMAMQELSLDIAATAGPRVCIGAQLAMSEAVLVLARLVRDNEMRLDPGAPVMPVGSFATRPSHVPAFHLTVRP